MEYNSNQRGKYVDKINSYFSIKDINISNDNKYVTLRKKKKYRESNLNGENTFNLWKEYNYQIHLHLLKTNNDNIRNFSIDLNKPEYTMNNLKCLLTSKNDDEVKYGIYATRKFFQDILKEVYKEEYELNQNKNYNNNNINHINSKNGLQNNHNRESKIQFYKINRDKINTSKYNCNNILELFLENNIIHYLLEIIKRCQNKRDIKEQINLFECLWIFINISVICPEDGNTQAKFFSYFVQENNLSFLISLIDSSKYPLEIIFNDLVLLSNLCHNSELIKDYAIKSPLTSYLYNYLKTEEYLNSDVILKVLKLLYELYSDCQIKLTNEAYIILFKIFSFSLISFRNDSIINYSLEILSNLSSKDIPEVIGCFSDTTLLSSLNTIIFSRPINNNELTIKLILDIFYNIISKNDENIIKELIKTSMMITFYNNLLVKYIKEKIEFNYKIEENIVLSLNNIIYLNSDDSINYILNEENEIWNFLMTIANCIFPNSKLNGIKAIVNILNNVNFDINYEILKEIANSLIHGLIISFDTCYYICIQGLYLVIEKCTIQKTDNEIRNFLIIKGASALIEKVKIKMMNDARNNLLIKEDEEKFFGFLDDIEQFLK